MGKSTTYAKSVIAIARLKIPSSHSYVDGVQIRNRGRRL